MMARVVSLRLSVTQFSGDFMDERQSARSSAPNLDRLVTFYCDLFGFEMIFEFEWVAGVDAFDRMMAIIG